ncbi:hypothetical protein MJM68_23340, partial [Salmonella enterica subsp. enterica serovar Montevideo]|nr:hypothetical protein [Salmonella enterica subsp. enterica serovar Montevideo]
DFRDRFSEYTVKGYARANGAEGDDIDAKSIVSRKGTATDSDVTRYRPMIIIADSKITANVYGRVFMQIGIATAVIAVLMLLTAPKLNRMTQDDDTAEKGSKAATV